MPAFRPIPGGNVTFEDLAAPRPYRHAQRSRSPVRVLDGAPSPWLVFVREPDQLRVERAHQQLAFGVRLVELAEPNRHVAADDDRMPPGLDDDHLRAACVT